ncbi:hypothetical protein L198_04564 [Cryptococcus wingfieldii CBS 7118]|uniref:Rieske domain-containing protein n=1 Tax=Cryptococcus wingfieldii CBS 7118 TaxID=1295528 RepID=A0A1E3J2V2_9TREE|nr:hypothetical protein L198_04564 [Cryptococcus wingfieldii CBS 7118]ODN95177.1 hypothetical protein L198_04564 [Cryptococcus wingfieldii CBS 7118]
MGASRQLIRICPLKVTFTHTRFHLALRTIDHPVVYHRLLLFRINKPDPSLADCGPSSLEVSKEKPIWQAPELFCMEEMCPHLGAPLSHAEIEDMEDTRAIVCPWHQYDFDLKDGSSSTGLQACTYHVEVQGHEDDADVWIEAPHAEGSDVNEERQWELVEMRGVSEVEFLDPPLSPLAGLSLDSCPPPSLPPHLASVQKHELPDPLPTSLLAFAHLILRTSDPQFKCLLTREAVTRLRAGQLKSIRPSKAEIRKQRENGGLLDEPPREVESVAPGKAPKRGKGGSEKSRILMLHALANIEQYAIDLAWDIIVRFADFEINGERLPVEFFLDWAKVAEDEAKHYTLLARRLVEMGSYFGAHTVHAGLWESATQTADSLSARIAIIHLVAEARGIDMNPLTLAKLQAAGDTESTRVLEVIHADEITHVTTGHRWFSWLCDKRGVDPVETFRQEVSDNFRGKIKGPFNAEDRLKAGLTPEFYEDLSGHLGWKDELVKRAEAAAAAEGDEHLHPRLT